MIVLTRVAREDAQYCTWQNTRSTTAPRDKNALSYNCDGGTFPRMLLNFRQPSVRGWYLYAQFLVTSPCQTRPKRRRTLYCYPMCAYVYLCYMCSIDSYVFLCVPIDSYVFVFPRHLPNTPRILYPPNATQITENMCDLFNCVVQMFKHI